MSLGERSDLKPALIGLGILVVVVLAGSLLYMGALNRQAKPVNAAKIVAAAKIYGAGLKARGAFVPKVVPLQVLIDQRLLKPSDVSGFAGMDVSVSLSADMNRPQEVLIEARLANGQTMVLLADGSIRQSPAPGAKPDVSR